MTYPPTGPQSSQPGNDPYAGQQYGAPQQDASQYGAPQYGAPQGGFPAAPPAYGAPPQWGDQRPGAGTAAGVLGIIFTVFGFFGAAISLIALTGAMEASALVAVNIDGFPLALYFIGSIAMLVASVMAFIGAIQLLSGKGNNLLVLGTLIYICSRILTLLADLVFADGAATGTLIVGAVIGIGLAIMLVFLARGSDVQQWLERKKAAAAAYPAY